MNGRARNAQTRFYSIEELARPGFERLVAGARVTAAKKQSHPRAIAKRIMSGMSRRSHPPSRRWPFWLLLAAWVCANSPQAATYALLSWITEARSFTHQQRLTSDVAFLLGGEVPRENAVAKNEVPGPVKPPVPVPPDAVLKKLELSCERLAEVLPPALRAICPNEAVRACPDSFRAPPPHGPPRVNAA
jgi:hypothetical protein